MGKWQNNLKNMKENMHYYFFKYYKSLINVSLEKLKLENRNTCTYQNQTQFEKESHKILDEACSLLI